MHGQRLRCRQLPARDSASASPSARSSFSVPTELLFVMPIDNAATYEENIERLLPARGAHSLDDGYIRDER